MKSETNLNKEKKEILFYYESRQNPNGDPGFENQPRMMSDGTIMVTDVRIKRTMRDYAKKTWGKTLFVDFGEDGKPVTANVRAVEITSPPYVKGKNLKGDAIRSLLKMTFDVPLFGALVPIKADSGGEGISQKLTGPLQFGIGRSINQVQLVNPLISSHFVGRLKKKKGQEEPEETQFSTFGRFYSVEYALIKIHGALNPENLGKYLVKNGMKDYEELKENIEDAQSKIFPSLWNGTNELITRSKFPQRSILYLEITYDDAIYNDLPDLVEERGDLRGRITTLGVAPFTFEKLISTMKDRKRKIIKVRVKGCQEISTDIAGLVSSFDSKLIEEIAD